MSDPESDSPVGEPTDPPSIPAPSVGEKTAPVGDTDPLIAAKIRKLNAEAEQAEAGARQAEAADDRAKAFWTPRVVFQSVIGGIVTAALVAGWGIGYLRPLLTAGQLELRIDRHYATLDSIRNDSVFTQLRRDQDALGRSRDSLATVVTGLVAENSRSASRLEIQLQSQTATQIERDSLEALLEEIRVSNISLVTQSAALALVDTRWRVDDGGVERGDYEWHGDGTVTFRARLSASVLTLSWAIRNDSLLLTSIPETPTNTRIALALEGQTSFPIGWVLFGKERGNFPYEIERMP